MSLLPHFLDQASHYGQSRFHGRMEYISIQREGGFCVQGEKEMMVVYQR